MKGTLVQSVIGALDKAARVLGRGNRTQVPAHLITGKSGEELAYFYLRRRGYVMVARNWRSPRQRGELDLVGWDGDMLCFIEVKTRTTRDVKPAEAAVDGRKQKELGRMARDFLRRLPSSRVGSTYQTGTKQARFDVVSIYCERAAASPEITLFKNAFPMP